MAIRVKLASPYGQMKRFGGKPAIKNGRRGWTTGAYEGRKPLILFDGRKYPVAVPEHWIAYQPANGRAR